MSGSLEGVEPKRLGRYLLEGLLGEGAMGKVYLGFDPKLDRHVAIKVMSTLFSREPNAAERFAREARAIVKLRHPNIVEIFDHSAEGESMYLVMERLVGSDLCHVVEHDGAMPEGVAASIIAEVCRALEHAHSWGVIHRDLKPANVIAEWNGRVVLTDFGLVKAYQDKNPFYVPVRESTGVLGTPGFMAPEQMLGTSLGPETDVFAMGVMYFNLLTAKMPYAAPNPFELVREMQRKQYTDPRTLVREISGTSVAILHACLEPRQRERIQTAEGLRVRLQEVLRECSITDPRDAIARYLREPLEQAYELRVRQLQYLRDRLKLVRIDRDETAELELRARIAAIEQKTRFNARCSREQRIQAQQKRRHAIAWSFAASAAVVFGMGLGFLLDRVGF